MWLNTVDYDDVKPILQRLKFIKSKSSSLSEWLLYGLGKDNLTIRIVSSHWCGIHNHNIEVIDTKGERYSWFSRNNNKYTVILSKKLPNNSVQDFESELIEVIEKYV